MHSAAMLWLCCALFITFVSATVAKPVQHPEPSQASVANGRMDTLAGVSIGTNKATRSTKGFPRSLDSLGNANYLRSLDSIGGQNFLRSIESLNDILRDLDSETLDQVLEKVEERRRANYRHGSQSHRSGSPSSYEPQSVVQQLDYRTLDSLGGANLLRTVDPLAALGKSGAAASVGSHFGGKRLDSLSGLTLGLQKRTFDEVDRTAFDGFNKRNFDEVDRDSFDNFSKRNVRSVVSTSS